MSGPILSGIIAATVGGVIALRAIQANRAIARLRATLDTIERTESQDHYKNLTSVFGKFRRNPVLDPVLRPSNDDERKTRTEILFYLNHYELVAVGFRTEVLDKTFYAEFMRGAVVRDWQAAQELINRLREPDPKVGPSPLKYFEHFEALAREWEWEIAHEEKLRRQGKSKDQIAAAIAWFRKHPRVKRP